MKKLKLSYYIILSVIAFIPFGMYAQPGTLDQDFGGIGYITTNVGIGPDKSYALALQSDGKIVAVGASSGDNWDFSAVRYNTNGVVDSSFGTNGRVINPLIALAADIAYDVVIQSDGKIILGGESSNGFSDFALAKYDMSGQLDPSFGNGGIATYDLNNSGDIMQSMALQSDGKIIIAGYTTQGTLWDIGILRCNNDGSIDSTFGTNGRVITHVGGTGTATQTESVLIQSDGKIIIAANANCSNCDFTLLRYESDGSLDSTFGINGIAITSVISPYIFYTYDAILQSDGKIVISGDFSGSTTTGFCAARFNQDGSIDTSFGISGVVTTSWMYAAHGYGVVLDQNNKIIVVGGSEYQAPNEGFALARYHSNGILDSTFGSYGKVSTDFGSNDNVCAFKAVIQSDNKIVVTGRDGNTDAGLLYALARYNGSPASINESALNDPFSLYPNPAENEITLYVDPLSQMQEFILSIYNVQGQKIPQQEIIQKLTHIDISGFSKGIYIIKISDSNTSFSKKLIK